ncbi:hypothetical protein PBAL39_18819 [Pedobacter sp. BAL39]|uniref:hypothetical protein n=1 Tax=Pedobacter sp. BAL39 TaxID=391596 RepID=UPI000155990C|nr:hypothetical protein [Pedobacter sp. BAL39]EDM36956.1 hypothetical protein PBAL39_18819 [Pedobacter sp. BAL39]
MYQQILVFACLFVLSSCKETSRVEILPIDKELNEKFLSGKGLDTNYFNMDHVLQYYEVVPGASTEKQLLAKLNKFVQKRYLGQHSRVPGTLHIFFYETSFLTDYSKDLYRVARDSEYGALEKHSDELLAQYSFERIEEHPNKIMRNTFFYYHVKKPLQLSDTLSLK